MYNVLYVVLFIVLAYLIYRAIDLAKGVVAFLFKVAISVVLALLLYHATLSYYVTGGKETFADIVWNVMNGLVTLSNYLIRFMRWVDVRRVVNKVLSYTDRLYTFFFDQE